MKAMPRSDTAMCRICCSIDRRWVLEIEVMLSIGCPYVLPDVFNVKRELEQGMRLRCVYMDRLGLVKPHVSLT